MTNESDQKKNTIQVKMIKLISGETLCSKIICSPDGSMPIKTPVTNEFILIDPYAMVTYMVTESAECTGLVPWLKFNLSRTININSAMVVSVFDPFEYVKDTYITISRKRNELRDNGLLDKPQIGDEEQIRNDLRSMASSGDFYDDEEEDDDDEAHLYASTADDYDEYESISHLYQNEILYIKKHKRK